MYLVMYIFIDRPAVPQLSRYQIEDRREKVTDDLLVDGEESSPIHSIHIIVYNCMTSRGKMDAWFNKLMQAGRQQAEV